eukprot:CAMPEP_0175856408 /NCGR_PEP_ID=MMETSP0107_2-20121207/28489_1 /TAXON_ID=195067 ORGANISM="Goniomonas pacifica, Strain CCMP1869" /NCGR_SAMPLE_ID=MMETSP0107_2 /ASSEMBLY_ACC=CAM_ASM_000203 /LENGTH=47 /DNA_ID= /DNA_START= /DNA_END= /DNA_ORIENTATION=
MLVEAGANVNATNEVEQTPLLKAAAKGQLEMVQVLLAAGATDRTRDR